MTFEQRRNGLTTHFSERIPLVKLRISVLMLVYRVLATNDNVRCYASFCIRQGLSARRPQYSSQQPILKTGEALCYKPEGRGFDSRRYH